MKVLSPVGETKRIDVEGKLAPRLATLSDKVVGIIDDGVGKAYFHLRWPRAARPKCWG